MTSWGETFETGGLSNFDSTSVDGGDLSVQAESAYRGGYGLRAVINDTTEMYAKKNISLTGEQWMHVRFRLRSAGLTGVNNQSFRIIDFGDVGWEAKLYVRYLTASGWSWLVNYPKGNTHVAVAVTGDGITPDQWYKLELHQVRSSGGTATDGRYDLWVNDALRYSDANIDNNPPADSDCTYAEIRLNSIDAGFAATMDFDDLAISNEGRINPVMPILQCHYRQQ